MWKDLFIQPRLNESLLFKQGAFNVFFPSKNSWKTSMGHVKAANVWNESQRSSETLYAMSEQHQKGFWWEVSGGWRCSWKGTIYRFSFGGICNLTFPPCIRYNCGWIALANMLKADYHVSSFVVDVSQLDKPRCYFLWHSAHWEGKYTGHRKANCTYLNHIL